MSVLKYLDEAADSFSQSVSETYDAATTAISSAYDTTTEVIGNAYDSTVLTVGSASETVVAGVSGVVGSMFERSSVTGGCTAEEMEVIAKHVKATHPIYMPILYAITGAVLVPAAPFAAGLIGAFAGYGVASAIDDAFILQLFGKKDLAVNAKTAEKVVPDAEAKKEERENNEVVEAVVTILEETQEAFEAKQTAMKAAFKRSINKGDKNGKPATV
jgi:hypothetical protein